MNDDLHNIDDLFKKALEEHKELPSSGVWDNIDKSLDKKKVVSISKKYNKLKWAVAVLLLFSFGMAMYVLYIQIKNKEFLKDNDAVKVLKSKKAPANINPGDASNLAATNNTDIEKAGITTKLKKEEKNSNSLITTNNKIDLPGDKNPPGNIDRSDKQLHGNIRQAKLSAAGKTSEDITKEDQPQLLLKHYPVKKGYGKPAGIDSSNNTNENVVKSIPTGVDKGFYINKGQQAKSNDNFASLNEKYFSGIPVAVQLEDMPRALAIKPVSKIHRIPINTAAELNNNKLIPAKHNKGATLPLRNMKNSSTPLSAIIFFSPDLVSTSVRNDHPLFREDDRHEIEKDETIKFSSTIGILIDYSAGKNWKLESGVTFSTRFTNIEPKTIYARPDNNGNVHYRFNCSAGYSFVTLKSSGLPPASGDSIAALTSKNILQYIGLPLVVKYKVGKGRFSITPGAGISANFLIKGKIETTIPTAYGNESVTSNNIQGLKSTYFNGSVSVGAQYKLSKTFELALIPTQRFALSSINKEAPVKTYLNSISFFTGLIIKL